MHAFSPYQRDGPQNIDGNLGSFPNYPSTFQIASFQKQKQNLDDSVVAHENWVGEAMQIKSEVTEEDFMQPRALWKVLGNQVGQQEALVYNVACHLQDARVEVRRTTYVMFSKVDEELGRMLERKTEERVRNL